MRDIGTKAAAKSKGLNRLAKCNLNASERDVQRLTDRFQLGLPIPLVTLKKPLGIRYQGDFHALSLSDWLKFHLEHNTLHILVGLMRPNAQRQMDILQEFWRKFKLLKPEHQLWELVEGHSMDLSKTIPVIIHGDEGRGKKRSPFLIVAYHSYLGLGTSAANANRKSKPYLSLKLNYAGNSFTHRMLTGVLPKMTRDEIAFQTLMNFISEDAVKALVEGVASDDGSTYRMAVIQCSGDWMWLAKCGNLTRSYANVEKRPRTAASKPKGICHLCKAGQLDIPFEDLRPTAKWKETVSDSSDHRFSSIPALLSLPHEIGKAENFFAFDVWHCFHLGVAKTFTASVLACISQQMPGGNIDQRFSELTNAYLDFCKVSHNSPYITVITNLTLGWPDSKTFPNAQWSKGHVSTLMMQFIFDWFAENGVEGDNLFPLCKQTVEKGNAFISQLYLEDLWISAADGQRISELGYGFLKGYMQLAAESYKTGRALFMYMPKIHAVHHVVDALRTESLTRPWCLNPLAHAVQIDEDFVGKVCKVSRQVHPLQAITRTLQRTLKAAKSQYVEHGYLRG